MGIFIGGPRDGQRVTGEDLCHGPSIPCPIPVSMENFDPMITTTVGYYRKELTSNSFFRVVYHYFWQDVDQKEAEERAKTWHNARPLENDANLEREARRVRN